MVELYIDYLSDLLSAQTFYLKSVLNMLVVQLFKPGLRKGEERGRERNRDESLNVVMDA